MHSADAGACNVVCVSYNVAGVSCNVGRVSFNVARVSCNVARVSCNVVCVSCIIIIIIINDSIYPVVSKASRTGNKVSCQPNDCPNR